MIERLDIKDYENKEQLVWFGVINKINALVDAVNGILDYAPLEMAMKAEPEKVNMDIESPVVKMWKEKLDKIERENRAKIDRQIVETLIRPSENVQTVCSWGKAPLVLKDDIFVCGNTDCPACDEKYLHEELIRTRKALDIAVDVAKEIDELLSSNRFDVKEVPLLNITQTKISMLLKCINIEQITALEQKD